MLELLLSSLDAAIVTLYVSVFFQGNNYYLELLVFILLCLFYMIYKELAQSTSSLYILYFEYFPSILKLRFHQDKLGLLIIASAFWISNLWCLDRIFHYIITSLNMQSMVKDFKFSTMKLGKSMSLTMTTFKMSLTPRMGDSV